MAEGEQFAIKLYNAFLNFGTAFENPLPSFHPADMVIGTCAEDGVAEFLEKLLAE